MKDGRLGFGESRDVPGESGRPLGSDTRSGPERQSKDSVSVCKRRVEILPTGGRRRGESPTRTPILVDRQGTDSPGSMASSPSRVDFRRDLWPELKHTMVNTS